MIRAVLSCALDEARSISANWQVEGGPGGALVLFDASGVREWTAGGLASLEHGLPFTPATPTRWASISKQFAAATALLAGFGLDDTLADLVPDLPPDIGSVPLARAMDMTGAIPDLMETLWLLGHPFSASLSETELLDLCRRLPGTGGTPGEEMAYSNTGWRLIAAAYAERGGESYGQALRRLVLAPLGLDAVAFPEDEATVLPGLATPYWRDGETWRRGRYGLHFSPSGGLAGSAEDLARWGSALLAGRGPAAGLLDRLAAPRCFPDGEGSFYRLGLSAQRLGTLELIGHGGSLPGVKTHLLMAPALGLGVALVSNREDTDPLWLAMRVLAAASGEPLPRPAALSPGLYAEDDSEAWAEVEGEFITFMGVTDRLFEDGEGVRTLPAYLEVRLQARADGGIEGRVGGVRRLLQQVAEETLLDSGFIGTWRNEAFGARLVVAPDGTATLPGIHPRETSQLRPLPGGRAIAARRHGPWGLRPLLQLRSDSELRLVAHRSRILSFHRE